MLTMYSNFYTKYIIPLIKKPQLLTSFSRKYFLVHFFAKDNPTREKVREYDFTSFECNKEVIRVIQIAIDVLRANLTQQILLFDKVFNFDCANNNLPAAALVKKYNDK